MNRKTTAKHAAAEAAPVGDPPKLSPVAPAQAPPAMGGDDTQLKFDMSLYMHIYINVYISFVYIYMCVYIYICICMYVYGSVYVSVYVSAYVSVYVPVSVSANVYAYDSMSIYVSVNVYLHVHVHVYVYVCVCVRYVTYVILSYVLHDMGQVNHCRIFRANKLQKHNAYIYIHHILYYHRIYQIV